MAEEVARISKKQLSEQIGCDKQTVANAINALVKSGVDLQSHIERFGQTDYLDEYAASVVADHLSKRFPKPIDEVEENPYKILYDETKQAAASTEARYQKQIDQQQALIDFLQGQLADLQAQTAHVTAERDKSISDLAAARETLAQISHAGLFVNKRAIAAQYLALPAPHQSDLS